jgi:hypothetical protein
VAPTAPLGRFPTRRQHSGQNKTEHALDLLVDTLCSLIAPGISGVSRLIRKAGAIPISSTLKSDHAAVKGNLGNFGKMGGFSCGRRQR